MDIPLTPLAFGPPRPEPPREPRRAHGLPTARLWLLRHGAVDSATGGSYGNSDVALSAEGHRQTQRIADSVAAGVPAARIVSSPLSRALTMGEAIAERLPDVPFTVDPRLAELDRGAWQGIGRRAYMERWSADGEAWWRDPLHWRGHGGETEHELMTRVFEAVEGELAHLEPDGTLVVTAHRQVIRAFLGLVLGIPVGRSYAFELPVATGVRLALDERGAFRLERSGARRPGDAQAAAPSDGPPADVPTSTTEAEPPINR